MRIVCKAASTVALLCLVVVAHANLMTCTFTGHGSGSLAGTPFSYSNFTITAIGDTTNWCVVSDNVYSIENTSVSITIQDLGSYTFLTATRIFNNLNYSALGLSRTGSSPWDILDIMDVSSLSSWDMLTSFGPITVAKPYMQWQKPAVYTSGGILTFESSNSPVTFTAEVVSEPYSVIALFIGLVGLWGKRRLTWR